MLAPAIPALIAVLLWLLLRLSGHETHTLDGVLFVAAIAGTAWVLFRKPRT